MNDNNNNNNNNNTSRQRYVNTARMFISNKTSSGSKSVYKSKIKAFVNYLKKYCDNATESVAVNEVGNDIPLAARLLISKKGREVRIDVPKFPLREEDILGFFGRMTRRGEVMLNARVTNPNIPPQYGQNNNTNNNNNQNNAIGNGAIDGMVVDADVDDDVDNDDDVVDDDDDATVGLNNGKPYKKESIQGAKSALLWYLKEVGEALDKTIDKKLNDLMIGYGSVWGKLKMHGDVAAFEGCRAISFEGFKTVSRKFLQQEWTTGTFAWVFSVLNWSIGSRPTNINTLTFANIGWDVDAMTVKLGSTKSDQGGTSTFPVHIYHNAESPEVCCLLALAVYLFVVIDSSTLPTTCVFVGNDQDARYFLNSYM
jgi:hypothetical protein